MWNPPLTDEALGTRRSALGEAAELLARLVRDGARTICFMKSRKGVELLSRLVKQDLESTHPELAELVSPTAPATPPSSGASSRGASRAASCARSSPPTRSSSASTSASSTRRSSSPSPARSPRCARCGAAPGAAGRGLAVYVAGEDALDQFFCRHPEDFLERPVEAAILDHESALIYRGHLLCAAHEGPLTSDDAEFLGPRWQAHAELLESAGELRRRGAMLADSYVPRRPGALPGGGGLAALGVARELRDRRRLLGRAARLDRGRARALDGPRGRDLPAPRAHLRGARARPRAAPRARRAVRRRLVHAAQARDRHRDRAPARPPRDARRDALLRRGQRHRHGARLPAQAPLRPRRRRPRRARAAADELRHAGAVVRARRRGSSPRRSRRRRCSARCTRPSTRRSRCCR